MSERSAERGFSMIEMMIALTIGMVIMVAVAQLFYGNRQTSAAQDASAEVQETARFAALVLQREVRMAGMKLTASTGVFDAANPVIAGVNATVGAPNASDEVTVRFFGSDNAAGTAADNTVVDCVGNVARLNERVVNRFHIANNAAGEPSLYCQSTIPATGVVSDNELVPGVESMQILVGLDLDGDKAPNTYLPFNDAAVVPDQIVSLRISLQLRSADNAATASDSGIYNHFGTVYAPANVAPAGDAGSVFNAAGAVLDRRIRRLYATTITLRNRVN